MEDVLFTRSAAVTLCIFFSKCIRNTLNSLFFRLYKAQVEAWPNIAMVVEKKYDSNNCKIYIFMNKTVNTSLYSYGHFAKFKTDPKALETSVTGVCKA